MTIEERYRERYQSGDTPWDIGQPDFNLIEVVTKKPILSCKVLDIGCGTGDNSIWLAQNRFQVIGQGESMISIRFEHPVDIPHVHFINQQAFEQPAEANMVDKLRKTCPASLSLVAEEDNRLVGHILFSPAEVESTGRRVVGMGLAPMAVLPAHQRQGIGSALVRRGLDLLRERCCPFIIALGHPQFYPRFGFEIASKIGNK